MNTKKKGQLVEPLNQLDEMGKQKTDNQSNSVTVSHIFKIKKTELQDLFDPRFDFERAIAQLNRQGGVKNILKKLATADDVGIIGDDKDLQRRKNIFGANDKPLPQKVSFLASVKQEGSNIIWLIIGATAIFAGLCGLFVNGPKAIGEAISIILIAVLIIVITSFADWFKDRRFVELQSMVKDENVTVIRGKYFATMSVNVWDLVVGDIIMLDTGMRIPADCLIIESSDMKVDESPDDEEIQQKSKSAFSGRSGDPFLKADSLVIRGSSKAVICCVGKNSTRGEFITNLTDQLTQNTALQQKLKNLGAQFSKYAIFSSIIIFIILVVMTFIETVYGDAAKNKDGTINKEKKNAWDILFSKLPKHANLAIVLLIVSIPEGLPLIVGVSLAFSVFTMYKDRILVRKLDALERLGGCEEICCGKTATLTQNKMKVAYFYLEGSQIKNSRKDTFLHCELNPETVELVKDSIIYNSTALVEMSDTTYVPTGNGTEVGLLTFLQDADIPIHILAKKKLGCIRAILPFSSDNKFSAVAVEHPDKPGQIAIYIKGAPESIMAMCPQALGEEGIIPIQQIVAEQQGVQVSYRDDFQQKVHVLAGQPLRVLACAYAELHEQDWSQMEEQFPSPSHCLTELVQTGRIQFILIGAFGLRDKIRTGVKEAVKFARESGNMGVRLISGDHIETAQAVAKKVGIINQEERGGTYTVMHADQFEQMIGGFDRNENINDIQTFEEIIKELRVLARAKPEHKHMIVAGLKELNKTVVVTGDGINDVKSIQIADCGLAMGSGCSAAKEVSDIILVGDDFDATVSAIKWGRNIYHNVGRFLQFQVTVNISCLFTVAIGAPILAESPFSAVQLLWINLIMDTFAAFALATERPIDSVLKGDPFKADTNILTPAIWRQIIGMSVWNILVMVFLIIFGPLIAGLEYKFTTSANDSGKEGEDKLRHLTIIFNTFVFLQVFNEVNCRKIHRRDFKVFENIFGNLYFIVVVTGTFVLQVALTHYLPGITRTTSLTKSEWGGCIVIGASPLLISVLLKLTPEKWLTKVNVNRLVDENKVVENKGILKMYQDTKKIQVKDLKKKTQNTEPTDDDNNFKNIN